MNKSSSRSPDKWRQIIREQAGSGLGVGAFCRDNGLAPSTFFTWKRRLRGSGPASGFVEVKLAAGSGKPLTRGIEVRLVGGRRVMVRRGFDPQLLGQVVLALEQLAGGGDGLARRMARGAS
jgi:hypothetical protein